MIRREPVRLTMQAGEGIIPPAQHRIDQARFARLLKSLPDPLARIDVLNTGEAQVWEGDQA